MEEEGNKYDLDFRRHARHRKGLSKSILIRVAVGLALVFLLWYLITKIGEKKELPPAGQTYEVEIAPQ